MTALQKGLLVGAFQAALLCSVAGKFVYDRQVYPRGWMKSAPIDPNLPFRGRYVSLAVMAAKGNPEPHTGVSQVRLYVENGRVFAVRVETLGQYATVMANGDVRLSQPLAFFIPEHAEDPSVLKPDEELWVEVTVLPTGPPRPIRLEKRKRTS